MIIFSSFFSGMEIAFLSSNKLKLELDKKASPTFGRLADIFGHNPGQYITTILVGNNVALVIYSLQMSFLISSLCSQWGIDLGGQAILVETIISTLIIIFTAEFMPKAVVKANPNFYMKTLAMPIYLFYILFYPIARMSIWLSTMMLKIFGIKIHRKGTENSFNKIDLASLVEQASTDYEQENSSDKDIKLFQNALDFADIKVRHCMIPRIDMEAIDIDAPIEELLALFSETRFSRVPVFEDGIDNVVGYVNSKSVFKRPKTIREVVIEVDYVPESMQVHRLLSSFIKKHHSLAIVIDEFGGTAGMITIEDILEEIFGEIEDEHDSTDMIEKQLGDTEFVFSCRLEVDYLNEKYGFEIPTTEDYDTLAGYIIFKNNSLPHTGEIIELDGMKCKILKTSGSKLDLVKLEII